MSDLIIDFGRELYVPWQLTEGKVLYQDIAWFNGPASPYFNALMFNVFGVSMATLTVVNAVILAAIVTLVFVQLRRFFPIWISLVSCVTFLLVQGFGYVIGFGNYNYISPYSHEMTHGVLLSMLSMWLLHRADGLRWWSLLGAGTCWGLAFLTKPEFFVAITGMVFVSIAGPAIKKVDSTPTQTGRFLLILAAGLSIVGMSWLLLFFQSGASTAWLGISGSWYWIINSDVTGLSFYQHRAGTDQMLLNAGLLARDCVAAALIGSAIWLVANKFVGRNLLIAALLAAGALLLTGKLLPTVISGRVVAGACGLINLVATWRLIRGSGDFRDNAHLLAWCVMANLLLMKIILNVELFEYGFALAMPALVLVIPAALHWLPRCIPQIDRRRKFQAAMATVVVIEVLACCLTSVSGLSEKNLVIKNNGADPLRADPKMTGAVLAQTIEYLDEKCLPNNTVLVLPEGVMINYLLRRETPTRFVNFMPPELEMYREADIVRQFEAKPGDYLLLVNRRVGVYGKDHFGEPGFGDQIMNWVNRNYRPLKTFGATSADNDSFGVTVYQRDGWNLAISP